MYSTDRMINSAQSSIRNLTTVKIFLSNIYRLQHNLKGYLKGTSFVKWHFSVLSTLSPFFVTPLYQVKNCDMTDSKPFVNLVSEAGHIMSNVVEKVRNSYAQLHMCLAGRREYTTNKKTN